MTINKIAVHKPGVKPNFPAKTVLRKTKADMVIQFKLNWLTI
jgi:hypothetical protein